MSPDETAVRAGPGALLKTAFRTHPTGVALITARTPAGPVGLTASSVASVSVDPPALSFSVTRAIGSAGGLLAAAALTVHLLRVENVDVARAFARPGAPRFTPEQGWVWDAAGEPLLPGAAWALRCRPLRRIPVGSSTLVVAEVLDGTPGPAGEPLLYQDRAFRTLGPELP